MIWDLVAEKIDSLSRAQRLAARYMLDNPSESLFMTAQQIGKKSNTSEATVFRLATALGFPGFPDFKEALQQEAKNQLSTFGRLAEHRALETRDATENRAYDNITLEIERAAPRMKLIEDSNIKTLAEALCSAGAIYLMGLRSTRSLAIYMRYYLSWFFPNVYLPENDFFENYLVSPPKNSIMVGISFPRYTRLTLECVSAAKNAGLRTAAITDAESSPLAEVADISVFAPCVHVAHIDSLMIPLGVANSILIEVADRLGPKAMKRLSALEKAWEDSNVYC